MPSLRVAVVPAGLLLLLGLANPYTWQSTVWVLISSKLDYLILSGAPEINEVNVV